MSLLLPLLVACDGGTTTYRGTQLSEYFPYDGTRSAEYINEDTENIGWKLVVDKLEPTSRQGDYELVTFEWSNFDDGSILGSVIWSSSNGDGIHIHGYSVGTDAPITFDPPIQFGDDDDYMSVGEEVVTETGGYTFTATYIGNEDCPVQWGLDWEGCLHMRLDDGDGDDMAGPIFAGDYWLVQRYGPAWMHLTGYTEKWNLARYDWSGDGG
jgi:hypothetical protein